MRTEESVGISISEIWPLTYFAFLLEGSSVGTNLVDLNIFATAHRFIDQVSSKTGGIVVFKESVDLIDGLLQRTDRFII